VGPRASQPGLDLPRVAAAAHAAGQPLSALQLLEISAEESCELQPDSLRRDGETARLLLDVLTSLRAPDCARGVLSADVGGAAGALRLLQLRGEVRRTTTRTARPVAPPHARSATTATCVCPWRAMTPARASHDA